ncbi:MAG: hypothetical protein F3745_05395 [Nitrospinae bacterium]|nr:hypothetical protein [Nitrospinota bacterium]
MNSEAPASIRFVPTDVVSYRSAKVDISGTSSISDVLRTIQAQVEELTKESSTHEGLVVRLVLTGRTTVHNELQSSGAIRALEEEIHSFFEGQSPWVLVDLSTQTAGNYDIDSLKEGKDFVADLISLCEDDQNKKLQSKIKEAMKTVFETWSGRKYLAADEDIENITLKARNLTLDQLVNRQDH